MKGLVAEAFNAIGGSHGQRLLERVCASLVARAGVFAALYFAGAELGHFLSYQADGQTCASFSPPAGIFLATLVLTTNRWSWPAFVLAACIANLTSNALLHDQSVAVSLGFCLASSGEACIGAWLLRRFVGLPFTLTRLKDVLGLACLGALASPVFGATIGAGTATGTLDVTYWMAWRTWWIADALGVLVFAPLVLTWATEGAGLFKVNRLWRLAEGTSLLLGIVVVAEGVYGDFLPPPLNVPVFVLPFLLWAAMRFNPRTAAAALLVVALIGVWNTTHGRGPYAVMTTVIGDQILRALGTLGVTSLSVLLLAAVVAERKQADQKRLALIAKLQQALAEIKTLRGLIPICAWCRRIRDDKDYWVSVEDYIGDHTEARLSHGMCPECLAKASDELAKSAP